MEQVSKQLEVESSLKIVPWSILESDGTPLYPEDSIFQGSKNFHELYWSYSIDVDLKAINISTPKIKLAISM